MLNSKSWILNNIWSQQIALDQITPDQVRLAGLTLFEGLVGNKYDMTSVYFSKNIPCMIVFTLHLYFTNWMKHYPNPTTLCWFILGHHCSQDVGTCTMQKIFVEGVCMCSYAIRLTKSNKLMERHLKNHNGAYETVKPSHFLKENRQGLVHHRRSTAWCDTETRVGWKNTATAHT